MMSEVFEFEYNVLQEMLIVNHQDGFSYNMCYEGDVYSVTRKLNEQQATISALKEENEKLTKMLNANYKTNNELVQYIQMLERNNDE